MRKLTLLASALALSFSLNTAVHSAETATTAPLYSGVTVAELAQEKPIHWVSVEQIEHSLKGKAPMAVGFDIDDTVLFSSPGFYRGKQMFSPDSYAYLKNPQFWEKMNNGWDEFSIPKKVGHDLIAMHLKRGDHIYFITGRDQTKTESVTKTLQKDFAIPDNALNPVIFAGDKPGQNTKISWMKAKDIKIYYGDSDGDIKAAIATNARGIRLLRASNSTYQPLPQAGAMGEEVIINSQY